METKANNDFSEGAEYGVDSRYQAEIERESEAATLMEARKKKMKDLSKDQILRAKLIQRMLKLEQEN